MSIKLKLNDSRNFDIPTIVQLIRKCLSIRRRALTLSMAFTTHKYIHTFLITYTNDVQCGIDASAIHNLERVTVVQMCALFNDTHAYLTLLSRSYLVLNFCHSRNPWYMAFGLVIAVSL